MRLTGLFVVLLSVSACKSDKEKAIVGKWNADNLVECDDVVPIVANLVNIEFNSDGRYIFNSTLNIHEEGTYKIKKNHLFLQDKIRDKAVEKIVLITKLTSDSLVLEMNFKGKEQWLTFVKENFSTPKPDKTKVSKDSVIASTLVNNNKSDISTAIASGASAAKEEIKPAKAEEKPKAEPVKEVKKEEQKVGKKPEPKPLSKLEAYRKREAQRQEEEADRKNEEKKRRDAYFKREAQRKKEEAERKRRLKK